MRPSSLTFDSQICLFGFLPSRADRSDRKDDGTTKCTKGTLTIRTVETVAHDLGICELVAEGWNENRKIILFVV